MNAANQPPSHLSDKLQNEFRQLGRSLYEKWDREWPTLKEDIESDGKNLRCEQNCNSCCYTRRRCSLSEGTVILDYIEKEFPSKKQEELRLRVESVSSSLRKMCEDGYCESDDLFSRVGGMECPFLDRGSCSIYKVRPLDCRALHVTTATTPKECRLRPNSVNCRQTELVRSNLEKEHQEQENQLYKHSSIEHAPILLADVLSFLWPARQTANHLFSQKSLQQRLASRGTNFDETWQDDFSDVRILNMPLTLPDEGDYEGNLTLLRQTTETYELYGNQIRGEGIPPFCTLYKRDPDCTFDWNLREFQGTPKQGSELPYTCWMSDDIQERLMMWEAAKRARGRILCGGLGLGVFPQLTLLSPRSQSVDIVEKDPNVISLIRRAWEKSPWHRMKDCTIIESPVEDYLKSTTETYDTVYVDTWDAIYHEYLPHTNELKERAKRLLKPGGEILLWAYDLMIRNYLNTVLSIIHRKRTYLGMSPNELERGFKNYPLLLSLINWMRSNPQADNDEIKTTAYKLAVEKRQELGDLKLNVRSGSKFLLDCQLQ